MFNDLTNKKIEKRKENYGGLPEEGRKLLIEARDEIGALRLKIKKLESKACYNNCG